MGNIGYYFHWPKQYSKKYPIINDTQFGEDRFDLVKARNLKQTNSVTLASAYLIKGSLGSGILASHVAFAVLGTSGIIVVALLAVYMCYCLHILVKSSQIIYRRTGVVKMSYSEVGEASFAISPHKCLRIFALPFKIFIDTLICLDLFGACCCYQLMMAKTLKQVVDHYQHNPPGGGFALWLYMLFILGPVILICLFKRLDILAKISIVGNLLVLICIGATIYYSCKTPWRGAVFFTDYMGFFTFCGMTVFSMSCSGIVISVENSMARPTYFVYALSVGMFFIAGGIATLGVFGYLAWPFTAESPVTLHFPLTWFPVVLKLLIVLMLYITHAVNFWVPFNLFYYYVKKCHRKSTHEALEYLYRTLMVCIICGIGIVFPSVNKLMSFLGAFCLSNMAFVFPVVIQLATYWDRPGLGKCKWRLWLAIFLIIIGLILFGCGTYVSVHALQAVFSAKSQVQIDEIDRHGY